MHFETRLENFYKRRWPKIFSSVSKADIDKTDNYDLFYIETQT